MRGRLALSCILLSVMSLRAEDSPTMEAVEIRASYLFHDFWHVRQDLRLPMIVPGEYSTIARTPQLATIPEGGTAALMFRLPKNLGDLSAHYRGSFDWTTRTYEGVNPPESASVLNLTDFHQLAWDYDLWLTGKHLRWTATVGTRLMYLNYDARIKTLGLERDVSNYVGAVGPHAGFGVFVGKSGPLFARVDAGYLMGVVRQFAEERVGTNWAGGAPGENLVEAEGNAVRLIDGRGFAGAPRSIGRSSRRARRFFPTVACEIGMLGPIRSGPVMLGFSIRYERLGNLGLDDSRFEVDTVSLIVTGGIRF